ncbi:uncharacterized protein LOC122989855 isoform X2 [Thunnus albacares]|uniref:uncharacterized protein LOC122989855 isoform X2 n=1 Tax=Thunnus albacares TaxID=8236 RepID=UPI001CF705D3|nr:uncharacterized protein LOC122989855 isoform X2 [Thunnus albacares]
MLLHSCICRHAGRCISKLRSQTTMCVLLQHLTLICLLCTHYSGGCLCYSSCAAASKAPLVLCNSATQLQLLSDGTPNPVSKGAPAESGSMQSFSVNLSTPVRSQPDHPSLAARPSLLWLSLTCCHSRAIIMTLLHTIHLHGRVPEALCSSSQTTISLSLLPYFSTRPEFTRICYHITKIYASSSPPPVSRFHQGVILYYSRIHLPLSYPVTSRWGLIAKDFSTVIYHAYSINIIYFIKKLSLS